MPALQGKREQSMFTSRCQHGNLEFVLQLFLLFQHVRDLLAHRPCQCLSLFLQQLVGLGACPEFLLKVACVFNKSVWQTWGSTLIAPMRLSFSNIAWKTANTCECHQRG